METLASLYKEKDFIGLHTIFTETKSPVAALLMALIAYSGKHKQNDTFPTKKALSEFIQTEAMACLQQAAESGDIRVLRELGSVQMFGRTVNVQFGSTICNSKIVEGCNTYNAILEHPDATDEDKSFAHYCIGHMTEISTQVYPEPDNRDHTIFTNSWVAARTFNSKSKGYLLSTMRLAEWYLNKSNEQSLAIPLLNEIKGEMPYAYAHLSNAYSTGTGVEKDNEKASQYYAKFTENVDNYKLKCGSRKDNEISIEELIPEQ